MFSLVVHAGMKIASIAEKYMYIINQRQIKMVELYLFVNVSQNSYCPLLISELLVRCILIITWENSINSNFTVISSILGLTIQ